MVGSVSHCAICKLQRLSAFGCCSFKEPVEVPYSARGSPSLLGQTLVHAAISWG